MLATANAALTERYVKRLHAVLKSGTSDSRKDWFAVGDYKRLLDTCRTGQDVFILGLRQFGHAKLAEKAEKEVSART